MAVRWTVPLRGLRDLLYPPKCVFCGALLPAGEADVCARCAGELPRTETPVRYGGGFFICCVSPFVYEGRVRSSLLRYKFSGRSYYAPAYGRLMAECVRRTLSPLPEVVTWVPLARRRRWKRGYDQAQRLAQALGRELDLPCRPALCKVKNRPAQSSLSGGLAARTKNVQGVYALHRPVEKWLPGSRVLLVDDILTTGATLDSAAQVLRAGGAEEIFCVTLARTLKKDGEEPFDE